FAVNLDDTHIVVHLDVDHHRVGRLHNLVVVVVHHVVHGRTSGTAKADQAAVAHRSHFGAVVHSRVATGFVAHPESLGSYQTAFHGVRDLSVLWFNDPGGTVLTLDEGVGAAGINPEVVVTLACVAVARSSFVGIGGLVVFAQAPVVKRVVGNVLNLGFRNHQA